MTSPKQNFIQALFRPHVGGRIIAGKVRIAARKRLKLLPMQSCWGDALTQNVPQALLRFEELQNRGFYFFVDHAEHPFEKESSPSPFVSIARITY